MECVQYNGVYITQAFSGLGQSKEGSLLHDPKTSLPGALQKYRSRATQNTNAEYKVKADTWKPYTQTVI